MRFDKIYSLVTDSVLPQKDKHYWLYSLPAYDNVQTREELLGDKIESAKYRVPDKCILFNKLNVRFKRVWRIDNSDKGKLCSTEFLPLIVNEDEVDFNYAYYLLLTDFITKFLAGQNNNTSGSHKRIDPALFFNIDINLPSKPIQKRIGDFLFSIDQAIDACRTIIVTASNLISSYYDYWFLQYDFPSKSNRQPYKTSGGDMVSCPSLGYNIPKGWKPVQFRKLITINEETVNPFKLGDSILEHYSIPAYDASGCPTFDSAKDILSNKFKVTPEVFLVSKLNPRFKRIWDPLCLTDKAICSTEFIVCKSLTPAFKPFCFAIANSHPFHKFLKQHASSSTGSRYRLDPQDILKFEVAVPDDDSVINEFNDLCASCMNLIKAARLEINTLNEAKTVYLPLLMSGQIQLSRASQGAVPIASCRKCGGKHGADLRRLKGEKRKQCKR